MKQLTHIGTIEMVSLPNDSIHDVPAKIDTGADSSAIWASNIKVENGRLSFNFFGPGSAYFREEPVVSSAFKTTSVKNSFGHNETRYKIRLKVKVGSYTLTRWFSLADRSRNTYPILLGKNFLKGRFVVDVSQKYLISQGATSQSVLVLGATKSKDFFESVSEMNALNVSYDCIGYGSLVFNMDGLSTSVIETDSGKDVCDYGLAYFKSHNQSMEFAEATALYMHFKGKPVIDHELRNFVSRSKLTEYMKLATYGLPIPASICAKTEELIKMYPQITKSLGSPFVLKEITADRGKDNYLISTQKDFKKVLSEVSSTKTYVAQRYIENDGYMRVYVIGREAGLAVWRSTYPHKDPLRTHLNKPSGGSNASMLNLDELDIEAKELAEKAAVCMERQVAGVDLLKDKNTGTWYILEVNNAPQLRSGSYLDEKVRIMAKFFDKELQK